MRTNPILSPVDHLDPRIEPGSPALQVDSLPVELPGKPSTHLYCWPQFRGRYIDPPLHWRSVRDFAHLTDTVSKRPLVS